MAEARNLPLSFGRNSTGYSSTAYNGAAGHITDTSIPSLDSDKERLDSHQLVGLTKSWSPQREGLGSRLLSTLSNAQPAAAALRRSGSVLHSRTKSWAAYVPKLNAGSISTPDKLLHTSPNRIFGDLFNGESAPIRLGVPASSTQEETEFVMEYRSGLTERPNRRLQRVDTSMTLPAPKSSWFGRRPATPTTPLPGAPHDEFLNMNITNLLFPEGPADPLSPHAFNDLVLNATTALLRLQVAYREKVEMLNNAQPDIDAQKEETEEAHTRAEHLKLQLEEVCQRAQDQDRVNQELVFELSEARLKLQESVPKTVRLVHRSSMDDRSRDIESEDDSTPRRHKRTSAGSASDSGFESDADTSSLFSAVTPDTSYPRMTLTAPPEYDGSAWGGGNSNAGNGIVLAAGRRDANNKRMIGESSVWSTVDRLRTENLTLQKHLDESNQQIQACIDYVGGLMAK